MTTHAKLIALFGIFVVGACARNGVMPGPATEGASTRIAQSVSTHGYFTEYTIPSGVHPSDLTRGPYNTVWFTNPGVSGAAANVYQLAAGTGVVRTFPAPAAYQSSGFDAIISLNNSVYYVVKQPVNEDTFYFARVTSTGAYSFTGAPYFEFGILTNFAQIPNTNSFTYGFCVDPCQSATSGIAAGASLTDYFVPQGITGGPGGDLYVTAICHGSCDPSISDSRVYVISPGAQILHVFALPNGSFPKGIVTGADHNLWITEPGINKIARMTPTGTLTQYLVPTANAGLDRITSGYDLALFFTETNANKIGRVTTAGSITQYTIPTTASHPTGITPCSSSPCGAHGGLWFTETAANKIGLFNPPI